MIDHLGDIVQTGYIVNDIDDAMTGWVKHAGVGPFICYRDVDMPAHYDGVETLIKVHVGIAYRGDMQIELIQPLNDVPSPYQSWLQQGRVGMHHLAFMVDDIDKARTELNERGLETCCTLDLGDVGRYAYLRADFMGDAFIELLQVPEDVKAFWQQCREAAVNWDGSNPIQTV